MVAENISSEEAKVNIIRYFGGGKGAATGIRKEVSRVGEEVRQ